MKLKYAILISIVNLFFVMLTACETFEDVDRHNYDTFRLPPVDTLKFTDEEIALITTGDSAVRMELMYYNEQPDSIVLRTISKDIRQSEPELAVLTDRMYATVRNPQNPGVGIAAPQVGINRRVVWVKRYDKTGKPWEVFVNVRITDLSDTLKLRNDGCLSIPGVSGQSWRAIWCDVEYELPDGTLFTERITHEYTAHIFQHEIDHLDAVLWTDRRPVSKNVLIEGEPSEYDGQTMPSIE